MATTYTPVPLSALVHSESVLRGGLGQNKTEGEREDQHSYDKRMKEISRGRKEGEEKKKRQHYANLTPLT